MSDKTNSDKSNDRDSHQPTEPPVKLPVHKRHEPQADESKVGEPSEQQVTNNDPKE